ncbi:hypothetical protein JOY44_07785 [Phormidium sp. CLA17]|uniref:hypothetical protein n=1 Tax=Leptolyngbya sp. Cla-17 TaxID=2803751 RepID=UPI0014919170|nr:hypothetical protein [Leptolyngbya sp. Cla-17]MBM0741515.1 hypothetical protein [Leptolyngbya sp. Cla-17]
MPISNVVQSLDAPAFVATLNQAAEAFRDGGKRPNAQAVIAAMVAAEKVVKQQRLAYPLEALLGHWRLCFTTLSKVNGQSFQTAKGIYVPKIAQAQISFIQPAEIEPNSPSGDIGNQIQVGSIVFRVTGSFRYPGKKNLLVFDFNQAQFSILGKTLYSGNFRSGDQAIAFEQRAISKLPFFAFFLITENFIAARGRGGGLALWVRQTEY